ncbi:MAG TPA: DUF2341 domain-containing protein [Bacteroidota bacterium]|nr:DUF2341 domain-containing protein [Bacteroidota bacterium]
MQPSLRTCSWAAAFAAVILCFGVPESSLAQPPGWLYSKRAVITETSGSTLTDYQVALTLNTQALILALQMNADGSDIRFSLDKPGTQLLDYWIESGINTPTTKIWVRVDQLLANDTKSIFLAYGNPGATAASTLSTFDGPNSSTDSVASGAPGGVGNSQRGFRFAPTEDLLVTSFGKNEPNGNVRFVTLFDNATQAIIAQTTVAGPAAQYSYQDLANPVWITQGTQYILELYQGAADGYYFGPSAQIGQHLTYLDMRYCNGCSQNTFPTNFLNAFHYGYPDLLYYTRQHASSEPTAVLASIITASAGPNGSISPSGDVIVPEGTDTTFTFTPDYGHEVDSIFVDSVYAGNAAFYQFTNVTTDHTISVTFRISPAYDAKYRTASYQDWATATDAKGKYKSIKRKPDKVYLKFNVGSPAPALGFTLNFSMPVTGVVTLGKTKTTQLGDSVIGQKTATFDNIFVAPGDTFQFDGIGSKGKVAKVVVVWLTSPKVTKVPVTDFKLNHPGLPYPNFHNVGEELFGSGQATTFPDGLLVGIPQGDKGANSVKHIKYTDVRKSMLKLLHSVPVLHADTVQCLNAFPPTQKPIDKQQKSLPPDKFSNRLFAELLTLKMNVTASMANKFPVGLGELTFDDATEPLNPFNGLMVNDIMGEIDSLISCLTVASDPAPTLHEAYDVLVMINTAFTDTLVDTNSFGAKTSIKGSRRLIDVEFLHPSPGAVPRILPNFAVVEQVPEQFLLEQNYPNPFNPTTTIQFSLPRASLVTLKVYNILGQVVATLLDAEALDDGVQEVEFNAGNVASGVYFYRLTANGIVEDEDEMETAVGSVSIVKKMLLMK